MNIFLTTLEKVLYGTFNDQQKLQNDFAYKCQFNEVFDLFHQNSKEGKQFLQRMETCLTEQ